MLRIINGTVYDPANGVNGVVRDVCISGGRIVESVEGGRTIDATGLIVFPGGVDVHDVDAFQLGSRDVEKGYLRLIGSGWGRPIRIGHRQSSALHRPRNMQASCEVDRLGSRR